MKIIEEVYGSEEAAQPLIVGKDTVYVHTNIEQIEDEYGNKTYKYREVQYTKDEYIAMMSEINNELQDAVVELGDIIGTMILNEGGGFYG